MDSYTKLFSSILRSTIWQESKETRLVWITMLALKDARQIVESSIPGLAKMAGVELGECEKALEILKAPDPYSRTKTLEGRRIQEVEGGWFIVNGEKHQQRLTPEDRKEYRRQWMANKRAVIKERKKQAEEDGRMAGVVEILKDGQG